MNLSKIFSLGIICLFPIGVEVETEDSPESKISVGFGKGQFGIISRSCSGKVLDKYESQYSEINVSYDIELDDNISVGLRSSYISDIVERKVVGWDEELNSVLRYEEVNAFTINPVVNFDWQYVGVGVGYFYMTNPVIQHLEEENPSFYLRLGNKDKLHFSSFFLHQRVVLSEGCFKFGLGYENIFWVGFGVYPSETIGPVAHGRVKLIKNLHLELGARYSLAAGISEPSANVGITYIIK